MRRLIKFLLTGDWHLHEWETIESRDKEWYDDPRDRERMPVKTTRTYFLKCVKCGIYKQQKFDR